MTPNKEEDRVDLIVGGITAAGLLIFLFYCLMKAEEL